jgi:hypothetical protein
MHSPPKVPLASILEHSPNGDHNVYVPPEVYLSAEFFHSVMDAVGISEKEFLEPKDMVRFMQEMLMFSVARSSVLTFMGKAHHRQLIPKYANELVRLILHDLQPAAQVYFRAVSGPCVAMFPVPYACLSLFAYLPGAVDHLVRDCAAEYLL